MQGVLMDVMLLSTVRCALLSSTKATVSGIDHLALNTKPSPNKPLIFLCKSEGQLFSSVGETGTLRHAIKGVVFFLNRSLIFLQGAQSERRGCACLCLHICRHVHIPCSCVCVHNGAMATHVSACVLSVGKMKTLLCSFSVST